MNNTDLHIQIFNKSNINQYISLYQKDIRFYQNDVRIKAKNFRFALWEHRCIASEDKIYITLPSKIQIGTGSDIKTLYAKKQLESMKQNIDAIQKHMIVFKDNKPLFSFEFIPERKVNYEVDPTLYISLHNKRINGLFFRPKFFFRVQYLCINYERQNYLNIYLEKDKKSNKILVTYDFIE